MSEHIAMVMTGPGEPPAPQTRGIPDPGPGEAVVRVRASSMNYHDLVNLMGLIPGPWPRVPMTDGAGEVVAVGDDAAGVLVGDRVIGAFQPLWLDGTLTRAFQRETPGDTGDGWLQQYKVFPAAALVSAPAHLSDTEAASLVCAGTTAWSSLEAGAITAGDVVVTMGTGGVSLFAVQLAKMRGATVIITSSSDDKLAAIAHLGADHTINYRTSPEWHQDVMAITDGRGADLVLDLGGPDTLAEAIASVRMEGTVAVIGVLSGFGRAEIPITTVMTRQINLRGITVGSVAAHRDLCAAVQAHGLRPQISHTFDWRELAEAQRVQQAGEHIGKITLTIE
ncbi:MAG: NAD(P)-dependent alcohol dehydrogenase [Acidimicrobiia bacterium]|nr:NAD(P)-dependent alcohol dehydrogenase [Acidimicrobiia bacterium]